MTTDRRPTPAADPTLDGRTPPPRESLKSHLKPTASAVGRPPATRRLTALALLGAATCVALGGCAARENLVDSMPRPEDEAATLLPDPGVAPRRPAQTAGPHYAPPAAPTSASATLAPPPPARPIAPPRPAVASSAGTSSALLLPVGQRAWRWIVIHHSATEAGNAAGFDSAHRRKGWDELGYHFVVDNGHGGRDGAVEVGPRWAKQKQGAHAKTPDNRFNDFGIGICLVGNFDAERPSPAQLRSTAALVANLMKAYDIPPDRVIGHRDTKATDCPGRYCDVGQIRRLAVADLTATGGPPRATVASAGEELMTGD